MQTKTRSPLSYAVGGCLVGFVLMVAAVTVISLLGPSVLSLSGNALANFINIGSWLVPIGLGIVGYIWGTSRQANQAQPPQADEASAEDLPEE